jgi:RNA polymerase sigma-70 factor (ECF subfamily)
VTATTAVLPFLTMTTDGRDTARAEPAASDAAAASPRVAADQQRVEELYLRLERKLTNVIYRWLWNREEVRDVLQEAFVRLWQMRDRVDWPRAEPLVYRIALNLAARRRRSRRLWQFVTLSHAPAAASPAAGLDSDDDPAREQAVRRGIDDLPERHRRVLVLAMHADMTYGEIGDVLGISAGTVGSRRNTAIRLLRRILEAHDAR